MPKQNLKKKVSVFFDQELSPSRNFFNPNTDPNPSLYLSKNNGRSGESSFFFAIGLFGQELCQNLIYGFLQFGQYL